MGKTIFALLIRLLAASRVDEWNILAEEDLPKGGRQKMKKGGSGSFLLRNDCPCSF